MKHGCFLGLRDMGVSVNGGTPISHPMIILSRKTHGWVQGDMGPLILEKSRLVKCHNLPGLVYDH